MAAAFGPPEAVNVLLNTGARIDAQDYHGFTPLMLAVGTGPVRSPHHQHVVGSRCRPSPGKSRRRDRARLASKFGDPEVIRALGGTPKDLDRPVRLIADPVDVSTATRTAITRSVQLLERTNDQFFKKAGCLACYEQPSGPVCRGSGVRQRDYPI
jgi:hypothetical protein